MAQTFEKATKICSYTMELGIGKVTKMGEWEETKLLCPECNEPLSFKLVKGPRRVNFAFCCEGNGNDVFTFEILTGLSNKDLAGLQ